MGITHYLAMTAAEFSSAEALPRSPAWMACHFSPYGPGLSNLPAELPPGALLLLDDVTPMGRHDPSFILEQLQTLMEAMDCGGLLLDFQRPGQKAAAELASLLAGALPFPVGVSETYGTELNCPVFLPPHPCSVSLEDYLSPWTGREVWLETSLSQETILLTESGSQREPFLQEKLPPEGFPDTALHCHYHTTLQEDALTFSLWRTAGDLKQLLEEAEGLGVTRAVGLFQELGAFGI